jgi:cyclophilin family peptidyl-prolyl cis-trans isomerase
VRLLRRRRLPPPRPGFVIQGGDPAGDGTGGPGYTIADEPITGTYHRGTVAMARTGDPHSQGSQFFIVLSDKAATALTSVDPSRGYAILGEVTSGMDVVDAIAAMPNSGSPNNRALEPVAMTSVSVTNP